MSNFNIFTIPQLKKIIVYTGISNFIKFSVTKPQLIQQIEKYIDFDGYNFLIKETNQQKFLKSGILSKPSKPRLSKEDKNDLKILEMIKKEIKELKEIYEIKTEDDSKKLNLLTNSLKESIKEAEIAEKEEVYPKKIIKKINIKKAKQDFNKLIEEPKKKKVNPNAKELIDDITRDFSSEKDFLNYLDYLKQTDYSAFQRTVKKIIDFHKNGIKLHLNVYNKLNI